MSERGEVYWRREYTSHHCTSEDTRRFVGSSWWIGVTVPLVPSSLITLDTLTSTTHTAPIGNSQSFNISLDAKALLEVVYGETTVENGAAYPADAVAQSPKSESCRRSRGAVGADVVGIGGAE